MFSAPRPSPVQEEALPRMEIVEYDSFYTVKVDIQRAGADGVAIAIDAGVLTVMSQDHSGSTEGACVLPRLNSFRYTLALPDDADETSVSLDRQGRLLILNFERLI